MSSETGYIKDSTITRSTVLGPPAALVLPPALTALVFCKIPMALLLSLELFALLLVALAAALRGRGDPLAGDWTL